jgi:hypothetical protein
VAPICCAGRTALRREQCDGFAHSIARQRFGKHVATCAVQQYCGSVFFFVSAHGPLIYNACAVTSHNIV